MEPEINPPEQEELLSRVTPNSVGFYVFLTLGVCLLGWLFYMAWSTFQLQVQDLDDHLQAQLDYELEDIEAYEEDITLPDLTQDTAFSVVAHFPEGAPYPRVDPFNPRHYWFSEYDGFSQVDIDTKEITKYPVDLTEKKIIIGTYIHTKEHIVFNTSNGIGVLNKNTGEQNVFTTADGLADTSNIAFHLDPYDEAVVWIGTFRGLTKFDLSSMTMRSYKSEMGIGGSQWQPRVFYIDEEYVWVTVNANAYSNGGVARLTKATNEWTSWSLETFEPGISNGRADFIGGSAGSDRYIVTQEDRAFYVFDRETQTWSLHTQFHQTSPTKRILHVENNDLYYRESPSQQLIILDLVSGEKKEIDYEELFLNLTNKQPVKSGFVSTSLEYDQYHERFVIRERGEFVDSYNRTEISFSVSKDGVSDVEQVEQIDFSFLSEAYPYTGISILDHQDSLLLFQEKEMVVLYDTKDLMPLKEWKAATLLNGGITLEGKIYDDYVGFHTALFCDGMCRGPNYYYATTSLIDRTNFTLVEEKILRQDDIPGAPRILWGDVFSLTTIETDQAVFAFSDRSNNYQLVKEVPTKLAAPIYSDEYRPFTHSALMHPIWYQGRDPKNQPGAIVFKMGTSATDAREFRVPIKSDLSPFGEWERVEIYEVTYGENAVWFATNYGVVRFDPVSKEIELFTHEDGVVPSSSVEHGVRWISLGEGRFLQRIRSGTYLYEFGEFKK